LLRARFGYNSRDIINNFNEQYEHLQLKELVLVGDRELEPRNIGEKYLQFGLTLDEKKGSGLSLSFPNKSSRIDRFYAQNFPVNHERMNDYNEQDFRSDSTLVKVLAGFERQ
jgi:hypothetical protein